METELAQLYSDVFAPEYFVLVCTLALLVYEWQPRPQLTRLLSRIGVIGIAWALAFAIYQSTPLFFEQVPSWGEDLVGGLGLGFGFLLIWAVWKIRQWGRFVPEFAILLISITVFHSLITPFWDISSHVIYAMIPAGYLSLTDRRFGPLLIVPLGMVVSRPVVGAHTWLQSISGFVLAGFLVLGLGWLQSRTETTTNTQSSNTQLRRI